jgi:uncharacterized protein (TIGR02145 family)
MNKKFLFSTNGAIQTFYKKNDFIEHCQKMFNQIGESKKKEEFLFSYDGGQNWYSINDFKLLRQTIQNEKYTAPDKQQVNLNSNKRTPLKSDKFYNEVKQILFALVFFGGLVYIIKGTNFLNTIKDEFENFNTESNFSLKSDEEQNSVAEEGSSEQVTEAEPPPSDERDEVEIGNQVWKTQNLDVATFKNGDVIPEAQSNQEWVRAWEYNEPAWCYYDNDPENGKKYGKLYNHYAVMDSRGLCPTGWHVPTGGEWTTLETFLGGSSVAGGALKNTVTQPTPGGWDLPNTGATNSSGFSAGPGGLHSGSGGIGGVGYAGGWWSSSLSGTDAWRRYLYCYNGIIDRDDDARAYGFSVRCLRD